MEAPPSGQKWYFTTWEDCSSLDGLAHGLSEIMNKERFSNYWSFAILQVEKALHVPSTEFRLHLNLAILFPHVL